MLGYRSKSLACLYNSYVIRHVFLYQVHVHILMVVIPYANIFEDVWCGCHSCLITLLTRNYFSQHAHIKQPLTFDCCIIIAATYCDVNT